jgi:hypothetical protein
VKSINRELTSIFPVGALFASMITSQSFAKILWLTSALEMIHIGAVTCWTDGVVFSHEQEG